MSDTYIEGFCHFVWATKKREDMIGPEMEPRLHDFMRRKCQEMDVRVYALNGLPDHLHLACSVPMSVSVPEFMQTLKGGSAYYVNCVARIPPCLY